MNASGYLRLSTIGIALLGAGVVAADEAPPAAEQLQQRERARNMNSEERAAYREQNQERVRNMTPEEQRLMRETSADGRARMENRQSASGEGMRRGGGEGGGYGQGYESRRGDGSGGGGGSMGGGKGGGRHR